MEITTKELRRCDVVTAKGRVDASSVRELAQALAAIENAGRYKIVLNMKEVDFISSAGLNELIETQRACKQMNRGELLLAEVPPKVTGVLELAGLTPLFRLFETEAEAVGTF